VNGAADKSGGEQVLDAAQRLEPALPARAGVHRLSTPVDVGMVEASPLAGRDRDEIAADEGYPFTLPPYRRGGLDEPCARPTLPLTMVVPFRERPRDFRRDGGRRL